MANILRFAVYAVGFQVGYRLTNELVAKHVVKDDSSKLGYRFKK